MQANKDGNKRINEKQRQQQQKNNGKKLFK